MKRAVARYGTAIGALLVFAGFALTADHFFALSNLLGILRQISYIAILGIGFSLALTAAELDLSFANVASLAAVVTGLLVQQGQPVWVAFLAGLGTGLGFGLVNGLIVTRLKVPSLIATLATASIANGLAFMITGGVAIMGRWPRGFTDLGRASLLQIPVLVWWTALAGLLALLFLKQTRTGLHLVCTGQAEDAASLAGIPVRRMKSLGLALSGAAAGLTAVLLTASLSSAAPNGAGDFLLTAIAAVMLGMTMFEPGHPNIAGTLAGAVTIGMLSNGLVLLGAAYYVQDICLGFIIIASVSLSASVLTRAAFHV